MIPIVVGVSVVAVLGLWFAAAYNRLVELRNQVANAWNQIDVQLKRRHDLIPNLVATVKGAMNFEHDTLEAVIAARGQAVAAMPQAAAGGPPAADVVRQTAVAEGALTGALGRLLAVVESYPQLKATGNVTALQEEIASTENKISFARQLYNDQATAYNTIQQTFPVNLVSGTAGAFPVELWAIADVAEREAPQVDFALGTR
jgi:LemA protein